MKYILFMLAATLFILIMLPFWALVGIWGLNFKEFNTLWNDYKRAMHRNLRDMHIKH